jgi:RNA polymerase sigma-70 factor (ECF subfamily)
VPMTIAATGTTTIQIEKSSQEANKLTLVQRAQRGDGDAFAEVFELFKGRIYRLCLSMTKNVSEAEDLTQEAFLQAFRNVGTFRGDSAFSTWLYRVAQNTVLMEFRRSKGPPMLSLDEPLSLGSGSPRHELGRRDPLLSAVIDRITLHRAMLGLSPGCRRILGLHEIQGYQHQEIAHLLHCSIGTSKSQLHKAKQKMRLLLFTPWMPSHSR